MEYFKVENQDGDEIEIQSPVFGYYVSGDRKMFVLSDHPPDELGMSYVFQTYIVNPGDHDWTRNLYLIWFGSHAATNFLVWSNSFEDALEEAAGCASDAGMKGFFVDDENMKELYDEAREELGADAEDDEVMQQAEADLTYTESGYVPSYEWGGQDVHKGQAFGDGKDLYMAAKFVCEAYTDDSDEERFELVPNGSRGHKRNAAHYDDYIITVPRMSAQRRLVYAYNPEGDAWGSMVGLAKGFGSEKEAFDWCQSHAFQRNKQSALVFREKHGGDVVQVGHVGMTHRGGSYQPNARLGELPAKSTAKIDEHAARELELFIENDYALVGAPNSKGKSIEKNLEKKIAQGKYDFSLSVKLWEYLIEDGARKYAKEFADAKDWHQIFSPATRRFVAERFAQSFADERQLRQNRRGASR